MLSNGNPAIFVSKMDRSVNFHTNVPGLKLAERFGNTWASIEGGKLVQRNQWTKLYSPEQA